MFLPLAFLPLLFFLLPACRLRASSCQFSFLFFPYALFSSCCLRKRCSANLFCRTLFSPYVRHCLFLSFGTQKRSLFQTSICIIFFILSYYHKTGAIRRRFPDAEAPLIFLLGFGLASTGTSTASTASAGFLTAAVPSSFSTNMAFSPFVSALLSTPGIPEAAFPPFQISHSSAEYSSSPDTKLAVDDFTVPALRRCPKPVTLSILRSADRFYLNLHQVLHLIPQASASAHLLRFRPPRLRYPQNRTPAFSGFPAYHALPLPFLHRSRPLHLPPDGAGVLPRPPPPALSAAFDLGFYDNIRLQRCFLPRANLTISASFSAAYASSRAFADCTFSAAVASLIASASFSLLAASDCATSIFAVFSPVIALRLP